MHLRGGGHESFEFTMIGDPVRWRNHFEKKGNSECNSKYAHVIPGAVVLLSGDRNKIFSLLRGGKKYNVV